jgi:hypothetical protein
MRFVLCASILYAIAASHANAATLRIPTTCRRQAAKEPAVAPTLRVSVHRGRQTSRLKIVAREWQLSAPAFHLSAGGSQPARAKPFQLDSNRPQTTLWFIRERAHLAVKTARGATRFPLLGAVELSLIERGLGFELGWNRDTGFEVHEHQWMVPIVSAAEGETLLRLGYRNGQDAEAGFTTGAEYYLARTLAEHEIYRYALGNRTYLDVWFEIPGTETIGL